MESQGYLLCAEFNLHQISLHRLLKRPDQAHYRSESFSLLHSDRIDFHPVDLLLDSDASILIVDTGGWYDLCCPSSGTDQRVASGGIYRLKGLTQESRAPVESRRLQSAAAGQLPEAIEASFDRIAKELQAEGLGDRGWLKLQSLTELSDLYAAYRQTATPSSASQGVLKASIEQRYEQCLVDSMGDSNPEVAIFACHLAALHRIEAARGPALSLLQSSNASLRRSAAEVLGRIGVDSDISLILNQINLSQGDRTLVHSLVYALIEGAEDQPLLAALQSAIANKQLFASTAALVRILNQRGKLAAGHADVVLELALSQSSEWSSMGLEVLEAHPQWSDTILQGLASKMTQSNAPPSQPLLGLLARWSGSEPVSKWVAKELLAGDAVLSRTGSVPQLIGKLGDKPVPGIWNQAIAERIEQSVPESASQWQSALSNRKWLGDIAAIQSAIVAKAIKLQNSDLSEEERHRNLLGWLATLPKGSRLGEDLEGVVLQRAFGSVSESDSEARAVRQSAWQSLSNMTLESARSRVSMLERLGNAGALELPLAIETYLKGSTPEQDAALLEVLNRIPAAKTLSVDGLLGKLKDRPADVQKKWKESIEMWTRPDQDVSDKVDLWLGKLKQGDPKQGYHVFRSTKATCSACHQVGYVGGNVGPVLSKIGQSRSRRDLVEAILFPSARLEQAYRSTKVRLQDGEVVQGLVVSESANELVLQVAAQQRRSIETSEIESREASTVSIMPAGLESQLSIEEFSDLIAFLESAK